MSRLASVSCAVLVALTACGGESVTNSDTVTAALSERAETAHIVFHYAAGDTVDSRRQEAFHDWVTPRLDVSLPGKLQYYKYRSGSQLSALTGRMTNGFAEPERLEVHSVFPWDAHEAVHVYSALVGRPTDFFNEGLAVALAVDPLAGRFTGTYSGEPVHTWARRNQASLRPIAAMVTTDAFRGLAEGLAYQEAGSFVAFLLDSDGFGPMRELFRRGRREDALDAIRTTFEQSFGFPLAEAERRWRAFLESD